MFFMNQDLNLFTEVFRLSSTRVVAEAIIAYYEEDKGWGRRKFNEQNSLLCWKHCNFQRIISPMDSLSSMNSDKLGP